MCKNYRKVSRRAEMSHLCFFLLILFCWFLFCFFLLLWPFSTYIWGSPTSDKWGTSPIFIPLIFISLFILLWPLCTYTWHLRVPSNLYSADFLFCFLFHCDPFAPKDYTWRSPLSKSQVSPLNIYSDAVHFVVTFLHLHFRVLTI